MFACHASVNCLKFDEKFDLGIGCVLYQKVNIPRISLAHKAGF